MGTLRPRPEKTTCSFPHRFSGKNRNSGLVPGHRDPKTMCLASAYFNHPKNRLIHISLADRFVNSASPLSGFVRSGKSQNESFPNFSNFRPEFCPEFCSEFFPNFSRTFRASFRGRRRPEKIHQKSPPFFNAKFPGKHEKNIHKILLESRQSKDLSVYGLMPVQGEAFEELSGPLVHTNFPRKRYGPINDWSI